MRRTLALWLLLFAAYAATLGLSAFGASDYGGDEPHYLLAAESIVEDGERGRPGRVRRARVRRLLSVRAAPPRRVTEGRLNEPHGVGFPLLIAPAYAVGGVKGVELFLAAIAALAVALAYRLALRVVPDPWALGAAVVAGLSPPFLAYGSAVYPELAAGAALAGAALLALRLRERVARPDAFVCFALLGALPWLGTKFVPAGVVIGALAVRALWRAQRRTLAVGAVELSLFSRGALRGLQRGALRRPDAVRRGRAGRDSTDAGSLGGYLERSYRLVALFLDRDYGLLRWAPVFALAFVGLWWLWHSHRERLAQAVPGVRDIELAGALCAAALGAQLVVAAFAAPTMFGFWFPTRHLLAGLPLAVPLVAIGLRHMPQLGTALAALTVAASVWLYVDVRWGDGSFVTARPDAPFGPLTDLLPRFDSGGGWPFWLAGAIGVAVLLLVLREARAARQPIGT